MSSSHFNVMLFSHDEAFHLKLAIKLLNNCHLFFSVQIHILTSVYQDVCIPERKLRVNTFALIWQICS